MTGQLPQCNFPTSTACRERSTVPSMTFSHTSTTHQFGVHLPETRKGGGRKAGRAARPVSISPCVSQPRAPVIGLQTGQVSLQHRGPSARCQPSPSFSSQCFPVVSVLPLKIPIPTFITVLLLQNCGCAEPRLEGQIYRWLGKQTKFMTFLNCLSSHLLNYD